MLLLVAVLLRAGIPDGWMPNLAGAGEGPLVICTGAGPLNVHEPSRRFPAKPRAPGHGPVCAFAGLGSAPPVAPPVIAPPRFAALDLLDPTPPREAPAKAWRRQHSARAPPLLV